MALGRQFVRDLISRGEQCVVELNVLKELDRTLSTLRRGNEAQTPASLFFGKSLLLVVGLEPVTLGTNPDLQEMHRLVRRGVHFAMRDARAGAHLLHLAGAYDSVAS